jgi:exonuclease SbcC
VHELPDHHVDEDVRVAERFVTAATDRLRAAEDERDIAHDELMRAQASVAACRDTVARTTAELAEVPSADTLIEQRTEAKRRLEALQKAIAATRAAATAATAHRDSPENELALRTAEQARDRQTQLTALANGVGEQLADLSRRLAGVPAAEQLKVRLAEAQRLLAERDRADAAVAEAEMADQAAKLSLEEAQRLVRAASRELYAVRDRVGALGPPSVLGLGLAEGWSTLDSWARTQAEMLGSQRDVLAAQQTELTAEQATLEHRIRERCREVLGDTGTVTIPALADLLTRRAADADNELRSFDERLSRLRQLERQVADLRERAEVAENLGNLLRTDGFERWLMNAALEQLVDAATGRLSELSGGQYSLELDESSFAVRDHANADELRSARTLSGGETFLASLSLALALAEATADLAPEGAPRIESIFLDEGFGTLDADTLDTVATSIEELAASGRLVGIVSHIHELADRMPVRFEVTKTGGSATVKRIET